MFSIKLRLAAISCAAIIIGTLAPVKAHTHGDDAPAKIEKNKSKHSKMDHSKMDHSKMDHSKMDHSKMDHSKMDHSKMDHSKMDHSKMNHSKMNHSKMDHSKMDDSKMDHSKMDHSKMDHSKMDHSKMDHSKMDHSKMDHSKMDHSKMDHSKMDHSKKSAIKIHMAWSRALPPVATNGAAYLMIHNYSKNSDKIISASTPVANRVTFHANESKNGTTVMVHQSSIDLKAGGAITFKPGARHLMLMGLRKPLVAGDSFPLTLVLEKAGPITVMVKVKPLHL